MFEVAGHFKNTANTIIDLIDNWNKSGAMFGKSILNQYLMVHVTNAMYYIKTLQKKLKNSQTLQTGTDTEVPPTLTENYDTNPFKQLATQFKQAAYGVIGFFDDWDYSGTSPDNNQLRQLSINIDNSLYYLKEMEKLLNRIK